MWKFCGNAQFQHSFGKVARDNYGHNTSTVIDIVPSFSSATSETERGF